MLSDIPFTSRSLGTEDGGVEFSNISLRACLSSIHVATRFIGEQDQQDRHEKLAGLSGDIPSSSSKSCTSIIKIVRAAYVKTRNHYTQRESFEYSFARHIAGIHRCFMDALRDGSPRWSSATSTVILSRTNAGPRLPRSSPISRYNHTRRGSRCRENRNSVLL